MRIAVLHEEDPHETRVACVPATVTQYQKLGCEVVIETGLGDHLGWDDAAYREAGADIAENRAEALGGAAIVIRVRAPAPAQVGELPTGCIQIGYLDPFNQQPLVEALAAHGVRSLSMEMIPRSTIAQKMDALSSQHSLAGYYMVLLAAERLGKALPMMMTPAGTIQPARVFVIGAGVAGLQAIATAKRLGARVQAFDTRPVVQEQVESLGASFLVIDLGDTGQTDQGYAKELTTEQQERQRQGMRQACAEADIVITTAQLFGRPAPQVIDAEMVRAMRPGSIVVDYAVESGGNVAGSVAGEEVMVDGVRIIGLRNYPGRVAADASRMYAANCFNLIKHFWSTEAKTIDWGRDEEVAQAATITADGAVVSAQIRERYGLPPLPAPEPAPAIAETEAATEAPDSPSGDGGQVAPDSDAAPPQAQAETEAEGVDATDTDDQNTDDPDRKQQP